MVHKPNILVFDSGAGGLSIAKEILFLITECHLIYVADNAYFPYGNRSDYDLTDRVLSLLKQLINQFEPQIVVIACNTVSTLVLSRLRDQHPKIEFVGVVPAIKPAAKISRTGHIGVLATPATTMRNYTYELINDHAKQHRVFLHGSAILVDIAEQFIIGNETNFDQLHNEIKQLLKRDPDNKIDTIVLACTHFPLLKNVIIENPLIKDRQVSIIDSGEAVAKRTQDRLAALYHQTEVKNNDENLDANSFEIFLTKSSEHTRAQFVNYLSKKISLHT